MAEVQELVIDAANEAAEAGSYFVEFTEALDNTTGEFAKYTVLKQYFQFVDDANMDAYMDVSGPIFTTDLALVGGMTTVELVQDEIDLINLDAVVTNDGILVDGDAKPSELNAYKAALTALELADDEITDTAGTATKAEIIEAIDAQLEAIATALTNADAKVVEAETAMAAFEAAFGEGFELETEYTDVVAAVEALAAEDLSENGLATTTLEGKVDTLEAVTLDLTILEDAKVAMADFEAAWKVAYDADYSTGNAVSGHVDALEDPEDTNDADALTALKNTTTGTESVNALEAETTKLVVYADAMAATTATEMRALLFDLDTGDAFLNLSSVTKTEFAGYVVEALAAEETAPADFDALQTAVFTTGYLSDYQTLISDVNYATDIAGMITALTALENDAFDSLTKAEQAEVADAVFIQANVADFKTVAEIEAAMGL